MALSSQATDEYARASWLNPSLHRGRNENAAMWRRLAPGSARCSGTASRSLLLEDDHPRWKALSRSTRMALVKAAATDPEHALVVWRHIPLHRRRDLDAAMWRHLALGIARCSGTASRSLLLEDDHPGWKALSRSTRMALVKAAATDPEHALVVWRHIPPHRQRDLDAAMWRRLALGIARRSRTASQCLLLEDDHPGWKALSRSTRMALVKAAATDPEHALEVWRHIPPHRRRDLDAAMWRRLALGIARCSRTASQCLLLEDDHPGWKALSRSTRMALVKAAATDPEHALEVWRHIPPHRQRDLDAAMWRHLALGGAVHGSDAALLSFAVGHWSRLDAETQAQIVICLAKEHAVLRWTIRLILMSLPERAWMIIVRRACRRPDSGATSTSLWTLLLAPPSIWENLDPETRQTLVRRVIGSRQLAFMAHDLLFYLPKERRKAIDAAAWNAIVRRFVAHPPNAASLINDLAPDIWAMIDRSTHRAIARSAARDEDVARRVLFPFADRGCIAWTPHLWRAIVQMGVGTHPQRACDVACRLPDDAWRLLGAATQRRLFNLVQSDQEASASVLAHAPESRWRSRAITLAKSAGTSISIDAMERLARVAPKALRLPSIRRKALDLARKTSKAPPIITLILFDALLSNPPDSPARRR